MHGTAAHRLRLLRARCVIVRCAGISLNFGDLICKTEHFSNSARVRAACAAIDQTHHARERSCKPKCQAKAAIGGVASLSARR